MWYWSYVDHLRTPDPDVKLVFGDLVHQALAKYYKPGRKRGPHPAGTFEDLCIKLKDKDDITHYVWSDDVMMDMMDLGIEMLTRYVNHWIEQDKEYEVIASEQVFQVPIGRIDGKKIMYVGTVDGVWRHLPTRKIRFAEHKTAASIGKAALAMDEQIGAYWAFAPRWLKMKGILGPDEALDGILYNWLRKAVPNPENIFDDQGRKLNKDGSISKQQAPPYFERANTFRGATEGKRVKERVLLQVRDMLEAKAHPELHIYKNPGPQFMPNCQFCSFRDACELHETGNDYEAFIKAAYTTWDPYDAHERVERK